MNEKEMTRRVAEFIGLVLLVNKGDCPFEDAFNFAMNLLRYETDSYNIYRNAQPEHVLMERAAALLVKAKLLIDALPDRDAIREFVGFGAALRADREDREAVLAERLKATAIPPQAVARRFAISHHNRNYHGTVDIKTGVIRLEREEGKVEGTVCRTLADLFILFECPTIQAGGYVDAQGNDAGLSPWEEQLYCWFTGKRERELYGLPLSDLPVSSPDMENPS